MQRHPELRDKPLAVCGSQEERHGIVLAANYIAKPYLTRSPSTDNIKTDIQFETHRSNRDNTLIDEMSDV